MKKVTVPVILAASLFLFACNDGEKTTSETTSTNMSTDSGTGMMGDNNPDDRTMTTTPADTTGVSSNPSGENANTRFVTEAAGGSMMEVDMAKLAKQNSKSVDIKSFAEMIESDHSKAVSELKTLASSKNITLPDDMPSDFMDHYEGMKSMKGKDFDSHYIDMMVKDHEADITKFKNASTSLSDAEIKAFASKTLPVLEKHLKRAKELKVKMKGKV